MYRLAIVLLALTLAACGGGNGGGNGAPLPETTPTPATGAATTLDRYAPFYMGGQRLRGIVQNMANGEQYTQWRAENNKIWWSPTDAELMDVRVCSGMRWSFLLAFQNDATHQVYHLQNVRTTLDGKEVDCGQQDGAPYQPFDIPLDFQQTVEQWGYVLNPGAPVPYYWKATFTYGQTRENPCWLGNGPKTRSVIVQHEVWWDGGGGWTRGHASTLPWIDGRPAAVAPTMDWETDTAIDAGTMWRGGDSTVQLCLRDVTTW